MPHSIIFDHMFQLPLPILEKLLRSVIVYLVLVVLLRIFGKRELAQLNPFDLVVLLSLSNAVRADPVDQARHDDALAERQPGQRNLAEAHLWSDRAQDRHDPAAN